MSETVHTERALPVLKRPVPQWVLAILVVSVFGTAVYIYFSGQSHVGPRELRLRHVIRRAETGDRLALIELAGLLAEKIQPGEPLAGLPSVRARKLIPALPGDEPAAQAEWIVSNYKNLVFEADSRLYQFAPGIGQAEPSKPEPSD